MLSVMEIKKISLKRYSDMLLELHVCGEIHALGAVPGESAPGEEHCGKGYLYGERIVLVTVGALRFVLRFSNH